MRIAFSAYGRVQGVGFRAFVMDLASSRDLSGFVRNEWDGTVTGEVEGEPGELMSFREALVHGNGFSRVDRLDWLTMESCRALPHPFEVRY